jgi:hypothetical protein
MAKFLFDCFLSAAAGIRAMRLGRDQAIHESVFKKFYSDNYDNSGQHG